MTHTESILYYARLKSRRPFARSGGGDHHRCAARRLPRGAGVHAAMSDQFQMPPGCDVYDAWLSHNPADDNCEFCGIHPSERHCGWQPGDCTGECDRKWRDPDAELDARREK